MEVHTVELLGKKAVGNNSKTFEEFVYENLEYSI